MATNNVSRELPVTVRHAAWYMFLALLAEWDADAPNLREVTVSATDVSARLANSPEAFLEQVVTADALRQVHLINGIDEYGYPRKAIINIYSLSCYNPGQRSFTAIFNPFANDILPLLQVVVADLQRYIEPTMEDVEREFRIRYPEWGLKLPKVEVGRYGGALFIEEPL